MRTLLFLLVGFLLLTACVLLGRLFSGNYAAASYAATSTFYRDLDGYLNCQLMGWHREGWIPSKR